MRRFRSLIRFWCRFFDIAISLPNSACMPIYITTQPCITIESALTVISSERPLFSKSTLANYQKKNQTI
jgi:hypothetical protein